MNSISVTSHLWHILPDLQGHGFIFDPQVLKVHRKDSVCHVERIDLLKFKANVTWLDNYILAITYVQSF